MKEKRTLGTPAPQTGDLRREAERRLRNSKGKPIESMTDVDVRALLHELQVHQIELEMQNEELLGSQSATQELSDKYHDLFDFAPVGYYRLDERGRILEINRAGASLLGTDRSTALKQRLGQYVAMEHRVGFSEFCKRVLATATKRTLEIELRRNEEPVYVLLEGVLAEDGNGSRSLRATITDITDRVIAERALVDRTAEVQRLADQLRALAVDLSQTEQRERRRLSKVLHDHIQQLLVAARMQVEWLRRDNNTERMRATAQVADGILHEALEASRTLTLELNPPMLQDLGLSGGMNWLAARMQEKHQFKIHLRLDNKAEPACEDTTHLVFECARELIFNAVKHSGAAEAHVAIQRTPDDRIKLIIRDEGRGFDPDLLKKRRAEETTYGLFSIQQRLTHVGGRLEIATAPGKGTNIILTIPLLDAKAVGEESDIRAGKVDKTGKIQVREKGPVHRVLVVDDHKIMREGLVGLMQLEPDLEIVGQAADGPQAIELAEQLQPDVVIMDVKLGKMSGVEATRRIVAKNPNTKVIGLSMHTERDVADALRSAGAIEYLTKGCPSEDLIAAIRAACAG